ncbi:phage tail protein [Streptomonospora litoralis]|uniref:Peptidoglycan endopeptidase LytF n=1 Tax=Streptomonospora litoralis TaxID=2498135 RepID=A0A4P6Q2F5_9ACTN|nr:hypothetical protein [Streptomonospora litoralis]QBI53421.1 Peptidoglycan endopeptidase LytF precursor [Streptomonospora litoralis]
MATAGAVWIDVLPSMRSFGRRLKTDTNAAAKAAGLAAGPTLGKSMGGPAAKAGSQAGTTFGQRFGQAADKAITKSVRGVGKSAAAMLVSSLGSAGVSLTAALAPASGAILALPAAAGVAGAAMGTLAVGVSGVGDAMTAVAEGDAEKLSDAMEGLSPKARDFVRSWAGIATSFQPVRRAVQDRLFAGLGSQISTLADQGMPTLRRGMTNVAGSINALAKEATKAASTPMFRGQVRDIFAGTADATDSFRGSVAPLVTVIAELVKIGLPLVSQFGQWATGGLKSAAAFLASEEGAARMNGIVQRSVDVLGQLRDIGTNLGVALGGIFGAASDDGASLLDTIEQLSAKFATWATSAQGQQQLNQTFSLLNQIFTDLLTILPSVAAVVGQITDTFSSLPGPVQSTVTQTLAWSIVLGPVLARVSSLAPAAKAAVGGVKLLSKGVGATVGATRRMAQGFRSAQVAQSAFSGKAGSVGGALRTAWNGAANATRKGASAVASGSKRAWSAVRSGAASAGRAVTSAAASLGRGATQAGAALARMAASAARSAAAMTASLARMAAQAAAASARMIASLVRMAMQSAIQAARVVAGWVLMGVQSMIQAARMAAAWFIAMGPVGWVIAAVIGLVALVIANWSTVKKWTLAIWSAVVSWIQGAIAKIREWISIGLNWIKANWMLLLGILTGPIGLAVGLIVKYWDQIVAGTQAAWRWIKSTISNLWNSTVTWLVARILYVVRWIQIQWITLRVRTLRAWLLLKAAITNALRTAIAWVNARIQYVVRWIQIQWRTLRVRTQRAWLLLRTAVVSTVTRLRDRAVALFSNIRDWIVNRARALRDRVVDAANALRSRMVAAFRRARDGVKHVWTKLQSVAKKPVSFIINTVYNRGIVGLWNKVAKKVPGLGELSKWHPKGFARGGILPGQSSWRQGDDQLVPMRRGEGVYVSEAMRDPYERARLAAVNKAARMGKPLGRFRDGDYQVPGVSATRLGNPPSLPGAPGFAVGGIVGDWIGDKWNDIVGGLKSWATKPLNKLSGQLADKFGKSGWPGIPYRMMTQFQKKILAKLGSEDEAYNSRGGADSWAGLASASERLRRAARFARAQAGEPYRWGGAGPYGYDCSGFTGAIENKIRGVGPYFRRYSTHAFRGSNAPAGWVRGLRSPYMVGITHSSVGHTAGTLMGVNVESSGSAGVRVGGGARGAFSSMFPYRYGFKPVTGDASAHGKAAGGIVSYDSGGYLPPGISTVYNGTGAPEPVMTDRMLRSIIAAARERQRGGDGGDTWNIYETKNARATSREVSKALKNYDALHP